MIGLELGTLILIVQSLVGVPTRADFESFQLEIGVGGGVFEFEIQRVILLFLVR